MNFQELVDEVISITKRPDLRSRTESAVKAATLKMHHSDFYYKDLVETAVQFNQEFYLQNFVPSEVIPRYRKAKYIRIWQGGAPDGMPGIFLENIQIENSMGQYQEVKTDVFYMAGQNLQIRTSCPLKHILFGAYVHPVVSPEAEYDSWIAREYPYAIVYEAARSIFYSIALTQQSQTYAQMTAEVLREISMSSVDALPFT